jgi:hypothetical protein
MDAETLARDFGGKIAFLGGVDTQRLLPLGSPEDVRREVRRVKAVLGPHLIVSPKPAITCVRPERGGDGPGGPRKLMV